MGICYEELQDWVAVLFVLVMLYFASQSSTTCFAFGLHKLTQLVAAWVAVLCNSLETPLKFYCWCGSNNVVSVWLNYCAIECI
jgi:hypothetical protein